MHAARIPLLAAALIALTAGRASSQTIDVINARRVQDYVYLVHEPLLKDGKNGFTYSTDEHAGRDRRKPLTSAITIAGNSPEGVNVVLRFLNPITKISCELPSFAIFQIFP